MLYSINHINKQNRLADVEAPTSLSNQCLLEQTMTLLKNSSLQAQNQHRSYRNEHSVNRKENSSS